MLVQCTKKLLEKLKRRPDSVVMEASSLFSWHANMITIDLRWQD